MNKHTACDYSICTQCSFDSKKSKHDCYRGEDTMKNVCRDPCSENK